MNAILAEFDLPYKYPANVEKAAEKISDAIPEEEIAKREDFRGVTTFTIDPKDAKDFMMPFPPVSWIMAIGKLAFISPT